MKATKICIDEKALSVLRDLARKDGRSLSETVRLALQEFVARHGAARPVPSFVGLGRSGRTDVAEGAEHRLWTRPYDIYKGLDVGPGGDAVAPATETRRRVQAAIRRKLTPSSSRRRRRRSRP